MEEKPPAYDNLNMVEDLVGYEATIGMEEKPPAYDNLNEMEFLIQPAENQNHQFNQNNEQDQQQYNGPPQQQYYGQQQQQYNGQPQQQYNGPPQQQYNGPQQQYYGPQQQQYNGPQQKQHNEMDEKKQGRLRAMAITGIVFGSLGCFSVFGSLFGIAAIVLGAVALCTYKDEGGDGCSYGLACASLPLGLVSCVGLILFILSFGLVWSVFGHSSSRVYIESSPVESIYEEVAQTPEPLVPDDPFIFP